ncbi:MAG: LamG domain-containing protein [Candidatus Omnitrophica bacterium]|nr:LamG domain-containing protein [Candidatus Omnitrophota bacterium]
MKDIISFKKILFFYSAIFLCQCFTICADAAWLPGWDKRVVLSISSDNIDSDLGYFPLPVFLGTAVGSTNADVTFIFDELQNDANRFKLAVTKDDGMTQLYVEIEHWDSANEQAVLWVSSADLTLSGSTGTTLYLYYDKDQADNTAYVGDTDSAPAENVWDDDFILVHHLKDATTSTTKDSTQYDFDGTKASANNPTQLNGKIGKAQNFTDDNINHGNLGITNMYTVECWMLANNLTAGGGDQSTYGYSIMASSVNSSAHYPLWLTAWKSEIRFWAYEATAIGGERQTTGASLVTGALYHIVATATKSGNSKVFVNAAEKLSFTNDGEENWTTIFTLGDLRPARAIYFDGMIDEVRVSDVIRSDAYIKASYHAENDNLLSFSSEETPRKGIVLKDIALMDGVTLR